MIRFYAPDIDTMQALPEAESAHAVRVLRKKAGDEIEAVGIFPAMKKAAISGGR